LAERGGEGAEVILSVGVERDGIFWSGLFPKSIFLLTTQEVKSISLVVVSVCSPVNPTI
jgi:hypothetical protein